MLTQNNLLQILQGAVRVWEENSEFCFSRFTRKQEALLSRLGFSPRERSCAGMRLEFTTQGGIIAFDYTVSPGSTREYYGIELSLDGLPVHHVYHETVPHAGHFSYSIPPSETPVRVTVYFPHSVQLRISNLTLPADYAPHRRRGKYLAFGDSITQGHDAAHPNQSYTNLLADALDMELLNQAVGNGRFCPEKPDPELPFLPDLITVAYGTNDWDFETLNSDAPAAFLKTLTELYPNTPIVLMLPIWRAEHMQLRGKWNLAQGREFLKHCAQSFPQVRVIDCSNFVPPLPEYFYDGTVHPNDMGYLYFAHALIQTIRDAVQPVS